MGKEGGEGWLGRGMYLCECGGGREGVLLTTIAAGLNSREITIACEMMCMTIIQYLNMRKSSDEQLLSNFD